MFHTYIKFAIVECQQGKRAWRMDLRAASQEPRADAATDRCELRGESSPDGSLASGRGRRAAATDLTCSVTATQVPGLLAC